MNPAHWLALLALLVLAWGAASAEPTAADRLRTQFAEARQGTTAFDRPLYLTSTESDDRLRGDVYALIDRPHPVVRQALVKPDQWCAILILHLNTKYCRATSRAERASLDLGVGRRFDQPLADAYWVHFDYAITTSTDEYLHVVMRAPTGPMSTRDYRIAVESAPFAEGKSVLHLAYGYSYGLAGRLAMRTYLATLGRDKIGFSVTGKSDEGTPVHIGGVRGVVERNTMRYYLAVEAYLAALSLPQPERMSASLSSWYDATERYARQLHEIGRDEYLEMKRHELRRQAAELPPDRKD